MGRFVVDMVAYLLTYWIEWCRLVKEHTQLFIIHNFSLRTKYFVYCNLPWTLKSVFLSIISYVVHVY